MLPPDEVDGSHLPSAEVNTPGATDTELIYTARTCIRNVNLPVTNVCQVFLVNTLCHFLQAIARMVPSNTDGCSIIFFLL
jgi:hypothetical protein